MIYYIGTHYTPVHISISILLQIIFNKKNKETSARIYMHRQF